MPPVALVDPATIDTSRVLIDREGIRLGNPQRFEMEQLTAIISCDPERHLIIGYKDVGYDEFWIRGHMPDYALMPGVLICEAAAQLSSFYCHFINLMEGGFLGFGGWKTSGSEGRYDRVTAWSWSRNPRRSTDARQSSRPRDSSARTWSITDGSSGFPWLAAK